MCRNDTLIIIYPENVQYNDAIFYKVLEVKSENLGGVTSQYVYGRNKISIVVLNILEKSESKLHYLQKFSFSF